MSIRALGSESPFEHFVEAQTVENGKAEFSIEGALMNRASEVKFYVSPESGKRPVKVELALADPVGVFDVVVVGVGFVLFGFVVGGVFLYLFLALGHGLHHVSQRVLAHLAVGDAHADARNPAFDRGGALVDGFGAVVQIVDLPAPFDFTADGVVHNGFAVFHHERLHGLALGGGLL